MEPASATSQFTTTETISFNCYVSNSASSHLCVKKQFCGMEKMDVLNFFSKHLTDIKHSDNSLSTQLKVNWT
jgi:hypothetical protein